MTGSPGKGSVLVLDIERLAYGGRALSRQNGLVIFVDNALPGQKVEARITRKRKGYLEARVLNVLEETGDIVSPKCSHFGECGGCRFQNLKYDAQLATKHNQVIESLEHIGGFENPHVEQPIESPVIYEYRNKMEFSFGRQRWITTDEIGSEKIEKQRDFALGLHVKGRFDKILDLDECHLQSQQSVEILKCVRNFAIQSELMPYSTRDHRGFWRHLVIREGKRTEETLVNIVTADRPDDFSVVDALANRLIEYFPKITTIVHNINRRKAETATSDMERVLHGAGSIKERIGQFSYQVSANSFFQTNTLAAEILYEKVVEFADLQGNELVYDLYAGAGTISIYVAKRAKQVVGFEIVPDAIRDAQVNCELNAITNVSFVPGDLKDTLEVERLSFQHGSPDVILIDPPRAGMHPEVLKQVSHLVPEKLIYVSCNPTTFARDAKALCVFDYKLEHVQPVDMFPMTPHIELVALLRRYKKSG